MVSDRKTISKFSSIELLTYFGMVMSPDVMSDTSAIERNTLQRNSIKMAGAHLLL